MHSLIKNTCLCIVLMLGISSISFAQDTKKENVNPAILVDVTYGIYQPTGVLNERFGSNFGIGSNVLYFTPNNWLFGLEGKFFFGNNVKEDVLSLFRTPEGGILGFDQSFASVSLNERGWYVGASGGRVFTFSKKSRSGIRVNIGAGFFQHKIRIHDETGSVSYLKDNYKKGLDRLTNGFSLNEFIGYQHISKNSLVNFHVGFDLTQGFTTNQRDWNYDTMNQEQDGRLDLLWGFKVGWSLPLYLEQRPDEIFY